MKFVTLTNPDGRDVLVNLEHVTHVRNSSRGERTLSFVDGEDYTTVIETMAQIAALADAKNSVNHQS